MVIGPSGVANEVGHYKWTNGFFHPQALCGDLSELLEAQSQMQQALRQTIQGILETSGQLASASEELRAVSEDASRGIQQDSGQSLDAIAEAVAQINERNLVIASAAEEQAQVAREVDSNLLNIRDLSLQSSSGAQQTSTASHELSRLALTLNSLIGRFCV